LDKTVHLASSSGVVVGANLPPFIVWIVLEENIADMQSTNITNMESTTNADVCIKV
jgi:hypothetical protein